MARLLFGGAEARHPLLDGLSSTGTVSIDTTTPFGGGVACYEMPSGGTNVLFVDLTLTATRWYYARTRFWFSGNPAVDTEIVCWGVTTNYQHVVKLLTTGKIQGPDGTQTAAALTPGWNVIELAVEFNTINDWHGLCRVNGLQLGGDHAINPSLTPSRFTIGNPQARAHGVTMRFDDIAINDDQGGAQASWPGTLGQVRLSKALSDNAAGSNWVRGDGTAVSADAFDSLDNAPPVGVANASGTAHSQLKDSVSNITNPNADVDVNCQSYTAAGVPANNKINATNFVGSWTAGQGATAINVGGKILSNPTDAAEIVVATSTTSGGTWPANWRTPQGAIQTEPTVALGTQPVVRIGKRGATASMVMACFAGVMFEYEPLFLPGQLWPHGKQGTPTSPGQLFPRGVRVN